MSAEQLIALEAAQAELGTLYATACSFTTLHARAEGELLPQLTNLGSRLRSLVRNARLTEGEIEAAAREILSVRTAWQAELEQVRASAAYQQALGAFTTDRQAALADSIPQVFAGVHQVLPAPSLYFPVSPSSGRRRPGSSPFLSPVECADRILRVRADGYQPEEVGTEWWERELQSIGCADDLAGLETPIALFLPAADVHAAVFAVDNDPSLRIFTQRLRGPFSVVLAAEVTDEWWEAYQDSYRSFRDAVQRELAARGYDVSIIDVPR
jgi:hypothetical protein